MVQKDVSSGQDTSPTHLTEAPAITEVSQTWQDLQPEGDELLHEIVAGVRASVEFGSEIKEHSDRNMASATSNSIDPSAEFIAAGVFPYCHDDGGNIMFFLGKELSKGSNLSGRSKYIWSDFGGKREGYHESSAQTACREFSEETLGLWGGMVRIIARSELAKRFCTKSINPSLNFMICHHQHV